MRTPKGEGAAEVVCPLTAQRHSVRRLEKTRSEARVEAALDVTEASSPTRTRRGRGGAETASASSRTPPPAERPASRCRLRWLGRRRLPSLSPRRRMCRRVPSSRLRMLARSSLSSAPAPSRRKARGCPTRLRGTTDRRMELWARQCLPALAHEGCEAACPRVAVAEHQARLVVAQGRRYARLEQAVGGARRDRLEVGATHQSESIGTRERKSGNRLGL